MEKTILDFISNFQNPIFDKIAMAFNYMGKAGIIFIIIGLFFFIKKDTRQLGIHIMLSLIFCLILGNLLLKPIFARIRPYDLYNIDIIVKELKDYSFPSGHTFSAFATAFTVNKYMKKFGKFMFVFAIIMGITRLYLYVHFPTDVLGGIILGYICYKLADILMDKYINKKLKHRLC